MPRPPTRAIVAAGAVCYSLSAYTGLARQLLIEAVPKNNSSALDDVTSTAGLLNDGFRAELKPWIDSGPVVHENSCHVGCCAAEVLCLR